MVSGDNHVCFVTQNNETNSTGINDLGQLGLGTNAAFVTSPTLVIISHL